MARDFTAELAAASANEDWAAYERIWEELRVTDVDEAFLADLLAGTGHGELALSTGAPA